MKQPPKKLARKRFGRWLVLRLHSEEGGQRRWFCRCDCGTERDVIERNLLRGLSKSCGCGGKKRTHGRSRTPEYRIWVGIRQRCTNPNVRHFAYYGGRGIKVCKRWERFENFLADMGPRPSPQHEVDRINPDGNYTPSNCRWATRAEQNRNRNTNHLRRILKKQGRL